MLAAAADGKLGALYVVGEDPLSSYPDRARVEKALAKAPFVVVQDLFLSPTAQQADVVLPAASFAEKDGTFTNAERRIQRVRPGITSPGEAKTDFEILAQLDARCGSSLSYTGPAAVFTELAAATPGYAGIVFGAIGAQGVVWGGEQLAPGTEEGGSRRRWQAPGRSLPADYRQRPLSQRNHLHPGQGAAGGGSRTLPGAWPRGCGGAQVQDGDLLKVKGNGVELQLKAKVDNRLPQGVVFAPYHFAAAGLNRIYRGEAAVAVEVSQ